jgi:uncharacterized protein GlcG (DUF336 family)
MYIYHVPELSLKGAMVVLNAAIAKAEEMGVPQCIVIVDRSGNLLAFARMDGARFLSQYSATQKAVTAASLKESTGDMPYSLGMGLAAATGGRFANLEGGMPIIINGAVVGGIGVGSGNGEEDIIVAKAGIAALESAMAQTLPLP